jgi:AcrR family transcriptional regulator
MVKPVSSGAATARSLSAADWIEVATDALIEGGVAAVSVEPLAVRLGATKGSFYHHFESREALVKAALVAWERSQTEAVIDRLQLIVDPAERLRAVMIAALTDRFGGLRDAALLSSASDPLVKPVVTRVTARRLRYLTETYAQMGLTRSRARRKALLWYTAYLGLFEYLRVRLDNLDDVELRAYALELTRTLVPPARRQIPGQEREAEEVFE